MLFSALLTIFGTTDILNISVKYCSERITEQSINPIAVPVLSRREVRLKMLGLGRMQAANVGRSEVSISRHSQPAGWVNKDERYLRDLLNKSTAAAEKQQQAVVVESSELLNHIQ